MIAVRVRSPYSGTSVAHVVASYPGGHANTALCGAPVTGTLRIVANANCPACARALREGATS
jgi:hypothetical protein